MLMQATPFKRGQRHVSTKSGRSGDPVGVTTQGAPINAGQSAGRCAGSGADAEGVSSHDTPIDADTGHSAGRCAVHCLCEAPNLCKAADVKLTPITFPHEEASRQAYTPCGCIALQATKTSTIEPL